MEKSWSICYRKKRQFRHLKRMNAFAIKQNFPTYLLKCYLIYVMFLYHDSLSPSKASRFWWRFCGFIFIQALFVHTCLLIQRRWRWVILREKSEKHDYFVVESSTEDLFICIYLEYTLSYCILMKIINISLLSEEHTFSAFVISAVICAIS